MDSPIFWGDKDDEGSRKRVRSAAAAHSHRIGPRKPKAAQQSRAGSRATKRRSSAQRAPHIAAAPTLSSPGSAGKLTPTRFVEDPTTGIVTHARGPALASHEQHHPLSPAAGLSFQFAPTRDASVTEQPQEARSRSAHAVWTQNQYPQPHDQGRRPPATLPPMLSLQEPSPPQLSVESVDVNRMEVSSASHARNISRTSPSSPTMRLPQYSWTEYPRHGFGHNRTSSSSLQLPTQVATASRYPSDSPANLQTSTPHSDASTGRHGHLSYSSYRTTHPTSRPSSHSSSEQTHRETSTGAHTEYEPRMGSSSSAS